MQPPIPENDTARLAALGVMDSAPDAGFDQLVELAQELFEVPIALVAEDRQWFKACVGLEIRETSREISFCGHAVATQQRELVTLNLRLSEPGDRLAKERQLLHALPVIALSANAMPADIKCGLAAGFDDYLTKLLEPASFVATLTRDLSSMEGSADAF